MNPKHTFKRSMQRGFTLVELAIVLVIAGVILVGVLKGTDAINKAKVERVVADIKGLQASLLESQKRQLRLPGDCDNDGVIEIKSLPIVQQIFAIAGTTPTVEQFQRDPMKLNVCGAATAPVADDVTLALAAASPVVAGDVYNLTWNELRRGGVVDGHRTNLELARHSFDDVYLAGAMQQTVGSAVSRSNVIVVYGIPVWMAEAIDAQIDGAGQDYGTVAVTNGAAGPACTGRVRIWSSPSGANVTAGATAPVFSCVIAQYNGQPVAATSRDELVSISYQFDTAKLQF